MEFILSIIASSALTATLLAIAAFLGKSQLTHWLNKDIELIKASHQRELEAYKVSLIAQVEKTKAEQDIKKIMAIKLAECELEAFIRLKRSSEDQATKLICFMQNNIFDEKKRLDAKNLAESLSELRLSILNATPFLETWEALKLNEFLNLCNVLAHKSMPSEGIFEIHPIDPQLINYQLFANNLIRLRFEKIKGMN